MMRMRAAWLAVVIGLVGGAAVGSGCAHSEPAVSGDVQYAPGEGRYSDRGAATASAPTTSTRPQPPTPAKLPASFAEAVPIWVSAPAHEGSAGSMSIMVALEPTSQSSTLNLFIEGTSSAAGQPQPGDVFVNPSVAPTLIGPGVKSFPFRLATKNVSSSTFSMGYLKVTASTSSGTQYNYILVVPN